LTLLARSTTHGRVIAAGAQAAEPAIPDAMPAAPADRLFTPGFARLMVAQACFGYAFSNYFLLPKFLVTQLHAGPAEIGQVTALHGLFVVCFLPVMGVVVDRFGRRDFLTAGAVVMALASLAFVTVDHVGWWLMALRAVQGIAFAMAFVAGATLAADEAPPERLGQALGIFGLAFLAMNAIAPAAAEEIALRVGWPPTFVAAAVMALVSAGLSRRIQERPRAATPADAPATGLLSMLLRPRQLRMTGVISLVGIALGAMFTFHQPFALELGMTHVRSFFVAYAVAAVVMRVVFGSVIDRAGRRRVSIATLSLYVVSVAGMAFLQPGWLALFGAGLGVAHGLFYPSYNALALEGMAAHERGRTMGLFQAGFNAGTSLGAFALGALAERAGYPMVFFVSGGCAALALVMVVASPEGRR
jgi:MFS family permease